MQDEISMICHYEKERNINMDPLNYPSLIREMMNFRLLISRHPFFLEGKRGGKPCKTPQKLNE